MLIADPRRFDGVEVLGVDEHVWRHTRHGDRFVTVIIDLTPDRDRTVPSRLLDMVQGRSKQVFSEWLSAREKAWRDQVQVVAMDGFTGFITATTDEFPDATAVMDPFHVVWLAAQALDSAAARPSKLSSVAAAAPATRSTLAGGPCLPAPICLPPDNAPGSAFFAADEHLHVEATWLIYQQLVRGHRDPHRHRGRERIRSLIPSIGRVVPAALIEIATLGRTLARRAEDVLAYFDRPGTSNGPTEAINGRLEHLPGPPSASTTSLTTSPDHDWNRRPQTPIHRQLR